MKLTLRAKRRPIDSKPADTAGAPSARAPVAPVTSVSVPHIGIVHEGQPVVFLVNGYGGKAIPANLKKYLDDMVLENSTKPIVHVSNWNDILEENGSFVTAGGSPGKMNPFDGLRTLSPVPFHDDSFVSDMKDAIALIPLSCPLVIIGHSFGGDSVLSVVQGIGGRAVDFLGLLDPVGPAGFRTDVIVREIPSNVRYFFNRYQQTNPFPLENLAFAWNLTLIDLSILGADGEFLSHAQSNDQTFQNFRRKKNGNYRFNEIRIGGYSVSTGIPQLLMHVELPDDSYIQQQIIDILDRRVMNPYPWIVEAQTISAYDQQTEYVSGVRVRFSEAMQPSSFTLADVALEGGTLNSVDVVPGSGNTAFNILFAPIPAFAIKYVGGQPVLRIGPDILDEEGHPMDQNRDATPGDLSEDVFWLTLGTEAPIEPSIALGLSVEGQVHNHLDGLVNWPDPMIANLLADFGGLSPTDAPMMSLALIPQRPGYGLLTLAVQTGRSAGMTRQFALRLSVEASAIQRLYREQLRREPDYGELAAAVKAVKSHTSYESIKADLHSRASLEPTLPQAQIAATV